MTAHQADGPPPGWQGVASRQVVQQAGMLDVQIGRRVVLLVSRGGEIIAVQGLCPHQMARLAEGTIVGGTLQCPHHLAKFNLSDGACTGGWQLPPLRRYAVRIEGDQVLLPEPLVALAD